MKVTKIGHCCLLIEVNGKRILTDPGVFSDGQNAIKNIDIILITHEHQDHLHMDSLKTVLEHSPKAAVVTNTAVGKLLEEQKIAFTLLEHGESSTVEGIALEGFGEQHALIHSSMPTVQNTGYFIAERLFYPGDALTKPGIPVEVLALPVAGPWLKIGEAIDYAKAVKPQMAFPVHDAVLSAVGLKLHHSLLQRLLEPDGIQFMPLVDGEELSFADDPE